MPKNTKKLIAFFLAVVMLVTIVTPSNLWSAFSDSDCMQAHCLEMLVRVRR